MSIFQAVILGLVQGLAEFLPISSSGHLILTRALLGISDATSQSGVFLMFDILLHVGTLGAVIIVFWKDWWQILKNPFKSKTLGLLIVASLPALAVALVLNDLIQGMFTGWFLGISFLITGLFLTLAEGLSQRRKYKEKAVNEPGIKHAVAMGAMQGIALLPGVSRSGSTLLGGIASGLNRKAAAKFSFMMSAPAILGSLLLEGKDAISQGLFSQLALVPTLVGVAVAFISGLLAMKGMLKFVEKASLNWFALYVILLGIAVICVQLFMPGVLPALAFPGDALQDAGMMITQLFR